MIAAWATNFVRLDLVRRMRLLILVRGSCGPHTLSLNLTTVYARHVTSAGPTLKLSRP